MSREDRLLSQSVNIEREVNLNFFVQDRHGNDNRSMASKAKYVISANVGDSSAWWKSTVGRDNKIDNIPILKVRDMTCIVETGEGDPGKNLGPSERVMQRGVPAAKKLLMSLLEGVPGMTNDDKVSFNSADSHTHGTCHDTDSHTHGTCREPLPTEATFFSELLSGHPVDRGSVATKSGITFAQSRQVLVFDLRPLPTNEVAKAVSMIQIEHDRAPTTPMMYYCGITDPETPPHDFLASEMHAELMKHWWPTCAAYMEDMTMPQVTAMPPRPDLEVFTWGTAGPTLSDAWRNKFADVPNFADTWADKIRSAIAKVDSIRPAGELSDTPSVEPDWSTDGPAPVRDIQLEEAEGISKNDAQLGPLSGRMPTCRVSHQRSAHIATTARISRKGGDGAARAAPELGNHACPAKVISDIMI